MLISFEWENEGVRYRTAFDSRDVITICDSSDYEQPGCFVKLKGRALDLWVGATYKSVFDIVNQHRKALFDRTHPQELPKSLF